MRSYMWTAVLLAAALLASGDAKTQQPAAGGNPLDVVPEKMPFNTPYGTPISLEKRRPRCKPRSRRPTSAAGR